MTGCDGIRLVAVALRGGSAEIELQGTAGKIAVRLPLGERAGSWLDQVDQLLASTGVDPAALACEPQWLSSLTSWHRRHPEALVGDLVAIGSGLVPPDVELGAQPRGSLMSDGVLAAVLGRFCRGPSTMLAEPALCVPDMFADVAIRHPDRPALIAADGVHTFGELETSSRLLASRLRLAGAAADTIVAITAQRDSPLIIAMLAVLRAGSAFLLLDPQDPPELSAYKLDAAAAPILWCDEPRVPAWCEVSAVRVVTGLDDPPGADRSAGPEVDPRSPLPRAGATDLAYVIFTSGSTGRPKGVQIEHCGLTEHVVTQLGPLFRRVWDDGRPLMVGGTAPVTFDSFIDQVLPMLAFGHTLVLFGERQRTDPESFTRPKHQLALDVIDCMPSQLGMLIRQGLLTQPHPPKLIIFGGEKASLDLWTKLKMSRSHAISIYGATECTIGSMHADVRDTLEVNIGLPEGSARVYILNEEKQLLPPGLTGELYLAGPGVARGYVGHSNEAFSEDPFADGLGRRMYRTGDFGRLGPSGRFEFLGRRDDQVKIRGFRIEPAEIEAALESIPGIDQAAVIAAPPEGPYTHLVAFLVNFSDRPEWSAVRRQLALRLPDHMIPSRAEFCASFPLTHNGKIDREALRRKLSKERRPLDPTGGEQPASAVEKFILDTWIDVLNVPEAGVTDDFFELGGHSLAAMEIVARLRLVLPLQVPLDIALRARTVRDLAVVLTGNE